MSNSLLSNSSPNRRCLNRKAGYVLVLAVSVIAIISIVLASVVTRVIVFNRVNHALVAREQARLLALSGLQIALAQITYRPEKSSESATKKQDKKSEKVDVMAEVRRIGPLLNHWQTFAFTRASEGIDGSCEIYIASEYGKINLNELYNFYKKKFVKSPVDGFKVCQLIGEKLASLTHEHEFAQNLDAFFKERGRPLDDITQLLADKRFSRLKNYIMMAQNDGRQGDPMSLLDLFTVETKRIGLQPWFLSRSVSLLLGCSEVRYGDKELWAKLGEKLKPSAKMEWKQVWDELLMPVYKREFSLLPAEIRGLFSQEFETAPFSVVSYGRFNEALVKIYALIYMFKEEHETKAERFCIKKLYWM